MRICVAGPIATADLAPLLNGSGAGLPAGYAGAPLIAVLIGELLRQGHQVLAVTTDSTLPLRRGQWALAEGPGLQLRICPARPRAWRFNGRLPGRALDLWRWERRELAAAMQAGKPDLVHAHWTYEFALAALATNLPTLVTCHDSPAVVLRYTRSPYRALRYLMARSVLRQASHVTAVSSYMAEQVKALARAEIDVVPNPIADAAIQLGLARTVPADGAQVAMVCNGWGPRKNVEAAFRAFAQLRGSLPQAQLHCYGIDFGPGQRASRWVAEHRLEAGVTFHGARPHDQLLRELATADVLLHSSLEESFGVVLAEAMALGLPVVAGMHSGAVPWVVDDAALLVDVEQPHEMAAALVRLFTEPDLYQACSARGRRRAQNQFSALAVAGAYLERYSVLAASSLPSPQFTH